MPKIDNRLAAIIDQLEEQLLAAAATASTSTPDPRKCINYACSAIEPSVSFHAAETYALNYFQVQSKPDAVLYVCADCREEALDQYALFCNALETGQPLILQTMPKPPALVEIVDSDDDEHGGNKTKRSTAITSQSKASPTAAADAPSHAAAFSASTLHLIETELEAAIASQLQRIDFNTQCNWTVQAIDQRLENIEQVSEELFQEVKELQVFADRMNRNLYQHPHKNIEALPPLDLNTNEVPRLYGPDYPPSGPLEYAPVSTMGLYYAVRHKLLDAWESCNVTNILQPESQQAGDKPCQYRVQFTQRHKSAPTQKTVSGRHLAYGTPPTMRLNVGIRVIALFRQDVSQRSNYFAGIVAEPLTEANQWRYLIFFDDGFAQYVSPDNVRLVCECSARVWQDVHSQAADFTKSYLETVTTDRQMMSARIGHRMTTEWQGNWLSARVRAIDGSLVQMVFDEGNRMEWIYRGSMRLGPLFMRNRAQENARLAAAAAPLPGPSAVIPTGSTAQQNVSAAALATVNSPAATNTPTSAAAAAKSDNDSATPTARRTNVAKKSTASSSAAPSSYHRHRQQQPQATSKTAAKRPTVQLMNNSTIFVDDDNKKGHVVYYTAKKHMPPRTFVVHDCQPDCLFPSRHNLHAYSPLAKPLLCGWERQICRVKNKRSIMYRAPCGRRLRDMRELLHYLTITKCPLAIDSFAFDACIHCLAEYVLESTIVSQPVSWTQDSVRLACK